LNEPDIFEAVNDLINVALGPNEPEIPAAVNPPPLPPSSNEVTLVLNEALAGVNDPLIPAAVNGEANAPEISDAIWAELDNNVFDVIVSFVVILVLNEELAAVKDPLIPAAVNGEANAPEISDAI
tara:strand:- start:189 stop:563 length:375 start_codon:yes stop_codon:yes gene_type:complete